MLIEEKMLTKTPEEIILTHLGDMVRVFRFISQHFSDSVHLWTYTLFFHGHDKTNNNNNNTNTLPGSGRSVVAEGLSTRHVLSFWRVACSGVRIRT